MANKHPIKESQKDLALCELIAKKAHEGQTRYNGNAFITHPIAVAELCHDPQEKCIALLHDVLEDSQMTADDLLKLGVPQEIVDVVEVLTRSKGEPYIDYLDRVIKSPIATRIKLRDLAHNMSDLQEGSQKDKYRFAKLYLESRGSLVYTEEITRLKRLINCVKDHPEIKPIYCCYQADTLMLEEVLKERKELLKGKLPEWLIKKEIFELSAEEMNSIVNLVKANESKLFNKRFELYEKLDLENKQSNSIEWKEYCKCIDNSHRYGVFGMIIETAKHLEKRAQTKREGTRQ